MKKGSKNSSDSAPIERLSTFLDKYPENTTEIVKQGSREESNYQKKYQKSNYDKQSGSYSRETVLHDTSSGEFCWKDGTSGVKDEIKSRSTVRVGDRSGYTEIYREETIRDVTYNKNYGSKTVVPHCNYDRYGYDYDSDSD